MGMSRWFRNLRRGAERGASRTKSAARWSMKRPRGKKVRGKPAAGKNNLTLHRKSVITKTTFFGKKHVSANPAKQRRMAKGIASLKKRGMMRGMMRSKSRACKA